MRKAELMPANEFLYKIITVLAMIQYNSKCNYDPIVACQIYCQICFFCSDENLSESVTVSMFYDGTKCQFLKLTIMAIQKSTINHLEQNRHSD